MSFRLRSRIRLRRSPRLSIATPTNCWPERAGCRRTSPTSSSADRSSWRRCCGPPRVSRPRTLPGWPAKCKKRKASDGLDGVGFNDADAKENADYMTKFVPYLTEEAIEDDAVALLAEYAQARGVITAAPIPIEDIVEKHLKIGIEFDDTHRLFGVPRSGLGLEPDILGAMFFDEARIVIDESLDPEENPAKEGRYRFTLAHEGGGHWRLHRHLFAMDPTQAALFGGSAAPSIICRSSHARSR